MKAPSSFDFFTLDGVNDEKDADILGAFLKQFYESAVYVPKFVVVPMAVAEAPDIAEWLTENRGSKVTIVVAGDAPADDGHGRKTRVSLDMLQRALAADGDKTETADRAFG
jgi:excinuclease UvrABC nuclease subunit